ncbi:MAG: hypothetical protein NTU73_06485 [Ignavibacteriae bacterium]|nr:hypothetical protein [Ignavibacteriota bacterium]
MLPTELHLPIDNGTGVTIPNVYSNQMEIKLFVLLWYGEHMHQYLHPGSE